MVTFREFVQAFRELRLNHSQPVLVHAALSSMDEIRGGAGAVLGALLNHVSGIMAPAFTYRTMIYPGTGPDDNACVYGYSQTQNSLAEFFLPDMPADPAQGTLSETIRTYPGALRSSHPILSFSGINVEKALSAQTLAEPLAPIGELCKQDGVVLLIAADYTVNTGIHYAERIAGRKQFVRWALTPEGVRECPNFPGCPAGFEQAASYLQAVTLTTSINGQFLRAVQLAPMVQILADLIKEKPDALLCDRGDDRCESVRRSIQVAATQESRESIE